MFSVESLRQLLQHMEWADATVWRAVLAHNGARNDQRLRELLTHLHLVQRLFLMVWRNEPLLPIRSFGDFKEFSELRDRATSYYPEAREFLGTLAGEGLTRPILMPFVPEQEKRLGTTFDIPTLAETIFQVTSHSTYHRGQVNARLREVGGEPPLVDYIAWVWFGRPDPEWSQTNATAAR
jgi:uncharacterized damage-inducible protein DinB